MKVSIQQGLITQVDLRMCMGVLLTHEKLVSPLPGTRLSPMMLLHPATEDAEGFVLLAAQELDHTLEPGDVVAEVRSGLVETAACDCGAVE